ncbi:MAG TPA: class I SAM-dependent methyltransferase [Thermoplasmata archaeon]|nr:class I SAM-dependent methyltransferase [Thermoplasmata archaeon]
MTGPVDGRSRRGSSAEHRARWRATYEGTPYEQLPWFDPGPSAGVRLAVETGFFRKGSSVLDVGCGAGSNLLYLARAGYEAHGVDLSPGAVAASRARALDDHVSIAVHEGDALDLPYADGSFDALVDIGCFHTIPIHRRPAYVRETHRVLRPDGRFVLSWVAREHTAPRGPPHRPSLGEVTSLFESRFLFERTEFRPGSEEQGPSVYFAFLSRRIAPYPSRR